MLVLNDIRFRYLFIIAIIFSFYARTLSFGFIWDDFNYIVNSQILGAGTNFFDLWTKKITVDFWPVTYSFLWVLKYFFGNNPFAYHLTNIILFTSSSLLLFYLLDSLKIKHAFLIVIIFSIHPMNVAAVSWVFQIKTNLANIFGLLSAIFYSKYVDKNNWRTYFLSLFFLIISFLAKISLVMLPLIYLVFTVLKTKYLFSKKTLLVTPFLAVSIVLGLANVFWETGLGLAPVPTSELILDPSLLFRILLVGKNSLFYIYQSYFPISLMFIHPKVDPAPQNIISYLPALALIAFLAWSIYIIYFTKKIPSSVISFLVSFFLLLPALGLVEIYFMRFSYVAEHYLTLALVGFLIPAVHFFYRSRLGLAAIGIYILFLGYQNYTYTPDYFSEKTIFEANIKKNPNDILAHNVLGLLYKEENNYSKAIYHYDTSIELHPNAAAYYNKAVIEEKLNQLDSARENFEKSIELNPYISNTYMNLGVIYLKKKNLKVALDYFNIALEKAPTDVSILYTIGYAFEINNNLLLAKEWYQKGLSVAPTSKLLQGSLLRVSK